MLLVASETTYTNEILQCYHTLAIIVVAIANIFIFWRESKVSPSVLVPGMYSY